MATDLSNPTARSEFVERTDLLQQTLRAAVRRAIEDQAVAALFATRRSARPASRVIPRSTTSALRAAMPEYDIDRAVADYDGWLSRAGR
jgi:hypothetical protein